MSDIIDNRILRIALAVVLPNLGGYVSGKITRANLQNWYVNLNFPSYRPPNWVFPVVWPTLYSGMGYASYLVWRDGGGFAGKDAQVPLLLYGTQLALNWSWSFIFFGHHNIKGGLQTLIAVLAAAVPTAVAFYSVNKLAGALMVPYLAWLVFAGKLNYDIHRLNPETQPKALETDKTQ